MALSVNQIQAACHERFKDELNALKAFRASGGRVMGYTCHMFPSAVAAGLGFWPLRLMCGASSDAESSGEKVVRADVCPHVKCLLGNVSEDRGLHAGVDLWLGLYTCDQMKRGLQCLSEDLGRRVHPLQLPSTQTREAAEYYAHQVRRVVKDIEALDGLGFDAARARQWHGDRNEAAKVLAEAAYSLRVSPVDLHAMFHLFFIARPEGMAGFFRKIIGESRGFDAGKSVVLAGSPLAHEDTGILEELEARGISIIPLNCTGLNAAEGIGPVSDDDLPGSLAIQAFQAPACIRARPNAAVYERIAAVLRSTGASGLIVKSLKFCDLWYTERERLKRSFGVPVLVFDSDYAEGGKGRLFSRIDAFLEMLR